MKKKRKLNAKGRRKRRIRILKRIIRLIILLIPILLICMIGSCVRTKSKDTDSTTENEKGTSIETAADIKVTQTATLLSGGDVIMHEPFLHSSHYLNNEGIYDYSSIFKYINETYNNADYTILNFESTISENNFSSYPLFKSPSAITTALSKNGVDMCLLANNHIYDNFDAGLVMTQNAMTSNSLEYAGIYSSEPADHFKTININGIKIGIINYTYETSVDSNGARTINTIPISEMASKQIDTFHYDELDSFYYEVENSIISMEEMDVDYKIAYIHWGTEYDVVGSKQQTEIAQKLCDLGIDALIGGHPHVIQPVDLLSSTVDGHQMLCVYSLGNHLSNQYKGRIDSSPEGHTEDGLMIELSLSKNEDGQTTLEDVTFIPTWTYRTVGVDDLDNPEFYIFPLMDSAETIINAQAISNLDIADFVHQSLDRTNSIIESGIDKVNAALPIIY